MCVPRTRFVHYQRPTLERVIVEAAHRVLGVSPGAEFHEREPAWLAGVAVCSQRKGRKGANGGEVGTQLRLGYVIREVANKQAHRHHRLLLGEGYMNAPR
jgi:hypothetical protein